MEPRTEQFYSERAEALVDEYDRADPTYLAQVRTLAGARIVDAGCGTGRDVVRLREAGLNAVGVDRSAGMVAAGRRRYGLPQSVLAVDTLPELATLGDSRFEVVLSAAMLQLCSVKQNSRVGGASSCNKQANPFQRSAQLSDRWKGLADSLTVMV